MNKIDKILIIRLSSLGDIVLTTPVIKAIHDKFPNAALYYLTKTRFKELLAGNPYIDEIICVETYDGIRGLRELLKVIRIIRKMEIDLIVDLHFKHWSYLRTALWNLLLRNLVGAKIKIKCYRAPFKSLLSQRGQREHIICSFFKPLKVLGIDLADKMPELFLSSLDREWADNYFRFCEIIDTNLLIGIFPSASWWSKRWGEDKFRDICMQLIQKPMVKMILFGQEGENDLLERVKAGMDSNRIVSIAGLPIKKTASLMIKCKVILTNDSGPMHIASALKVPVIAIFGPTHPKLGYYPLGENNIILYSDVPCSPCSRWGEKKCRHKRQLCFDDIKVEDVLNKIENFINVKNHNFKSGQLALSKNNDKN